MLKELQLVERLLGTTHLFNDDVESDDDGHEDDENREDNDDDDHEVRKISK